MVSLMKLIVHFAMPKQVSRSASPSHLKTEKLGNDLRFFGKLLEAQLKVLFPDGDDTGTLIVPALDVRSQVLSGGSFSAVSLSDGPCNLYSLWFVH